VPTETQTGLNFSFTDEQQMLREMVHDFVEKECPKQVARDLEASEEYPRELADRIAEVGLHGVGIPEEYGGQGGDMIDQVIVCEELSRSLGGLSWMWGLTAFSGAKSLIAHGTQEQKDTLLPQCATGETRFAIALTEPGGGTDVLRAMRTRAKRVDGGFVLNGTKIWSTLAHVSDRLLVLARTSEGKKSSDGLTLFLVNRRSEGLTATPIPKLGMRAVGSCEVSFEDVFVPEGDILGEVDQGWKPILGSLNSERLLVAAMCLGIHRGVLEDAVIYANEREAFGKKIGAMQAIQHGIADMKMKLEASHLLIYNASWLYQEGRPCGVEATTAKCMAAEWAVEAADFGIQVLGGYGYAQEYNMQRYWRDARLYKIGPISQEMGRNLVGESLGLPRSF
jgi:acyl-CoA dehydrogenase